MAERPTRLELLEAVRRFMDEELIGELDGVKRFHALVASNALGIVARELELEGPSLLERHEHLRRLLGQGAEAPADPAELSEAVDALERALVQRIRAGDADAAPFRDDVLAYLERSVGERLAVDNPGYR